MKQFVYNLVGNVCIIGNNMGDVSDAELQKTREKSKSAEKLLIDPRRTFVRSVLNKRIDDLALEAKNDIKKNYEGVDNDKIKDQLGEERVLQALARSQDNDLKVGLANLVELETSQKYEHVYEKLADIPDDVLPLIAPNAGKDLSELQPAEINRIVDLVQDFGRTWHLKTEEFDDHTKYTITYDDEERRVKGGTELMTLFHEEHVNPDRKWSFVTDKEVGEDWHMELTVPKD